MEMRGPSASVIPVKLPALWIWSCSPTTPIDSALVVTLGQAENAVSCCYVTWRLSNFNRKFFQSKGKGGTFFNPDMWFQPILLVGQNGHLFPWNEHTKWFKSPTNHMYTTVYSWSCSINSLYKATKLGNKVAKLPSTATPCGTLIVQTTLHLLFLGLGDFLR